MWDSPVSQEEIENLQNKISEFEKTIDLLKEELSSKHVQEKMSISTCLLILYYTGYLKANQQLDREQLAELIRPLVGATGIENIKKFLSRIKNPDLTKSQEPFTLTDLQRVYDHLETAGHIDACAKVHADLETLRKHVKK